MDAPAIIQQLATQAGGTPIAWKEFDDHFVIVFEDGRKLTFQKADPAQTRRTMTPANVKEHVGQDKPSQKTTKANKD